MNIVPLTASRIERMSAGDKFEYHRGYLPTDRAYNEGLDNVASGLVDMAKAGIVNLFQKRLSEFVYSYTLVKK